MNVTDDLGRTIFLKKVPERIVSLVPSLTLTMADLGMDKQLVAVTGFCKYPVNLVTMLPKVGGPKNINISKIIELKPDIVFAVKEENDREQVLNLSKDVPVVVFDIKTPDDVFRMMQTLGEILQQRSKSEKLIINIKEAYKHFPVKGNGAKAVYLIWKKPWMAAGKDTFIGSMLQIAGFENIMEGRYPVVDLEILKQADEILLATEPYHFKEKERADLRALFPEKSVNIVNGELFTWFGTYLTDYLNNKLK
jgi:ABC-type Fe3+-hydroxamate transport system substrate-binding protein